MSPVRGARVRQLIRRFRACEAGAGLVEYGLLLALGALALIAAMQLCTGAMAGLTSRATFTISKQSAGGYAPGPNSTGGGTDGRPSPAGSEDGESPDSASGDDGPACPESGSGPCEMAGRAMSY
jgi:Flp pilus assembly pilin Flp